jgi:hypothetical protein
MLIVLGTVFLVIVLLGAEWFATAEPRQLARIAQLSLVIIAGLALILFVLSGRLTSVLIGILALWPFFPQACRLWKGIIEPSEQRSDGETVQHDLSLNLSRQQAFAILGLPEEADAQQIRAAHRRLIQKIHPDKGGSTFLAAQVNQAKEILLGESAPLS